MKGKDRVCIDKFSFYIFVMVYYLYYLDCHSTLSLYYFNSAVLQTSGACGVIVLERCSIELDADEIDSLFSFVIGMLITKLFTRVFWAQN